LSPEEIALGENASAIAFASSFVWYDGKSLISAIPFVNAVAFR
jgi:hypothetical protein